jgi:hypothetical protein
MQAWADDIYEQTDRCVELEQHLRLPDGVMRRVHERRNWYLTPDDSHASLEAYIDATHAALTADVRLPGRGRRRGGRAAQAPARGAQGRCRHRTHASARTRPARLQARDTRPLSARCARGTLRASLFLY